MKKTSNILNIILPLRGSGKATIPLAAVLLLSFAGTAQAQGTGFTYQGQLENGGNPVTGLYDFTNALYNASSGGAQVGSTITLTAVPVTNGLFTVLLDFDGVFNGTAYWLQIGVRSNGVGSYVALSPRQELTPTPYAITAENLDGTVLASQLTGTLPSGLLSGTYSGAVTLNNASDSFSGSGAGLTSLNASQLASGTVPTAALGNAWKIGGNAGTTAGVNYLGTSDGQPLYLDVNGSPVLKLATNNSVAMGNCTLGSGPSTTYEVALGQNAKAIANGSVAIGWNITSSGPGSVAIGEGAVSSGNDSFASGGYSQATNLDATAMGSSSIAGGQFSMALGDQAQALHSGAFVWADSSGGTFASTAANQFLIRATGGVGINITNPVDTLSVGGTTRLNNNALYLRNGSDVNHGLGYFSAVNTVPFAGVSVDGPVLFGYSGGGLGTVQSGTENMALQWFPSGMVNIGTTNNALPITKNVAQLNVVNTNTGIYSPGVLGVSGGATASTAAGLWSGWAGGGEFAGPNGLIAGTTNVGGDGVIGVSQATSGGGFGVYGSSSSGGAGVYGISSSAGPGVEAVGASSSSIALAVGTGGIQVVGAGIETSTAAFTHLTTAANDQGTVTFINNPLCNGDPNAILLVTHNYNPAGTTTVGQYPHPIGVYYATSQQQWCIYNDDAVAMATNVAFNVLIIKH
ncbi:MAG: hypothetical protein ABSD29_03540 [Verrucomicrobiota bacterium]